MQPEWKKVAFKILTGNPIRKIFQEGLGVDGRAILEQINTRKWVDSAQNRDYWRALVNAELNLPDP